jgi:hypothetical protein
MQNDPALIRARLEQLRTMPIDIVTEDGQPLNIPIDGALGLLALGYQGLVAWRRKREWYIRQHMQRSASPNLPPQDTDHG